MYLTGSKTYNLDTKLRLTLPAEYRRELGSTICLVPLTDCIYGFTPAGHKAWVDSFFPEGFDPRDRRAVKLRRSLTARTVTVDVDSAGRIALGKVDEKYRTQLGIAGAVVVAGNDDHFEIWNPVLWDEQQLDCDDLDNLMFGSL